ncbi:hypothetical protein E7V67_016600 [[Empedobacter] haloabium]|uniref:NAD(+)--protein-arginine ADP-ribosyltransferase Tre1-like N-terminal domain-containing protein n=1 Tax=[Empedobacter] haloabium TaxID=592317 RepID=A0ABZ1UF04_9BURK
MNGGSVLGATASGMLGAEILTWIGLGMMVMDMIRTVPDLCKLFAQGFACAWSAGELPEDTHKKRVRLMRQAMDTFAKGEILLVKAILTALVLYLSYRPKYKACSSSNRTSPAGCDNTTRPPCSRHT